MLRTMTIVAILLAAPLARAQSTGEDLAGLSLEDLLETSVASGRSTRLSDAPGVVTVITREEIARSGARDIDDLLQFVPGFQFSSDYNGSVAYGFRGLMGLEGKVLQMVDGIEQNDRYYNSTFVQNRFPVDEIDHIEIIRGPGSAMYGGAAEYAVINIVTHTGAQLHGARASVTYGRMQNSWGRGTVDIQYGERFAGDLDVSLKLFTGKAQRGDGMRDYPDGSKFSMVGEYEQEPFGFNGALAWRGLTVRVQIDRFGQTFRDDDFGAIAGIGQNRFDRTSALARYELHPAPDFTVAPEYTYSWSNAYNAAPPDDLLRMDGGPLRSVYWDRTGQRHKVALPFIWDPADDFDLRAGLEYAHDLALSPGAYLHPDPGNPDQTATSLTLNTGSAWAQGTWTTFLGGFTGGLRFEHNDRFGDSLVPRFAWTRSFGPVYAKALYSFAYRSPSLGNMSDGASSGADIRPERTRAAEVEIGWQITPRQLIAANVFDMRVSGPITYVPVTMTYANIGSTGSRGIELQYRGTWNAARVNLAASMYNAGGLNSDDRFAVIGDSRQLAGYARYKATAQASFRLAPGLWVTPSVVYLGPRTTFSSAVATPDGLGQVPVDASVIADLVASWEGVLGTGLNITAGLHNLFNATNDYLVAYDLGRDRMPGPSRELMVRVGYQSTF